MKELEERLRNMSEEEISLQIASMTNYANKRITEKIMKNPMLIYSYFSKDEYHFIPDKMEIFDC